ncbi:hypothetical protein K505DRAFT_50219 [Melanomma pulvis-pyrius CBS 109.77]|uniref:Uncharacterized protein n=1 Tax=Melanomma pulvis-pyrius CBS 109.77 TaxID=1314802 RepID=A0A6A6XAG0_9PLEO|nr:hypothetical protein K505DRAFT_50219 [Melanomma pulvis-pyrius CBS 109.77]
MCPTRHDRLKKYHYHHIIAHLHPSFIYIPHCTFLTFAWRMGRRPGMDGAENGVTWRIVWNLLYFFFFFFPFCVILRCVVLRHHGMHAWTIHLCDLFVPRSQYSVD